MCNSRKYPYLQHGRDFFKDPPPLWKFQLSFVHFFNYFGLPEPPTPPFCGGNMDIFCKHTMDKWNNYYIHVTSMQFWHSRWFLDCEMSSFVSSVSLLPPEEENVSCHLAFVVRDINIWWKSNTQSRLKSRKSYHCCKCYRIQISYKTHHKTFCHLCPH